MVWKVVGEQVRGWRLDGRWVAGQRVQAGEWVEELPWQLWSLVAPQ